MYRRKNQAADFSEYWDDLRSCGSHFIIFQIMFFANLNFCIFLSYKFSYPFYALIFAIFCYHLLFIHFWYHYPLLFILKTWLTPLKRWKLRPLNITQKEYFNSYFKWADYLWRQIAFILILPAWSYRAMTIITR
jgi:hypothetical protein